MFFTDHNWLRSRGWPSALVPIFLSAQILLIHAAASGERPPAPPALERFPMTFGQWKLFRGDPIEAEVAAELRADRLVSQTYIETPANSFASLLVAWFQTQQGGARQPHSPKVCLPSGGWTPRIVDEVTVDTVAGPITVNRMWWTRIWRAPWSFTGTKRRGALSLGSGLPNSGWRPMPCVTDAPTRRWFA